jgi:hypothetical protein
MAGGINPMGILGQIGGGIADNADSLIGGGMGLLGGSWQNAQEGFNSGARTDAHRRQVAMAQAQEEQERVALMNLGQKWGAPPEIAGNPTALKMWVAKRQHDEASARANRVQEPEFIRTLRAAGITDPAEMQKIVREKFLGGGNDIQQGIQTREVEARRLGLTPDHPAYQSFVLTGKMPREDAQPLTATDKKAILEADDQVEAAKNSIANLDEALRLSPKAYDGKTASFRGGITSSFGSEAGEATESLNNVVTTNALNSMKAVFGSNPTEGERQILLEVQGSADKPQKVREDIYARAKVFMANRLKFNQQRADSLRGGSFYKPPGNGQTGGAANAAAPSGRMRFDAQGNPIR